MMAEAAATEMNHIDWLDVFARASTDPGGVCFVSTPPAARKGNLPDQSSLVHGDRASIDWVARLAPPSAKRAANVRFVSTPPAARKGNRPAHSSLVHADRASIDWVARLAPPSAKRAGKVRLASPPPAAAKGKARRDAETEAEFSRVPVGALRRELAGMSDGALRREIADLRGTLRRFRPLLAALEAEEARRRRRRGSLARSQPKDAEAEYKGMSNEGILREIKQMSDDELRREITGLGNSTLPLSQPHLAERRRRLRPLLQAEARRRRQGS